MTKSIKPLSISPEAKQAVGEISIHFEHLCNSLRMMCQAFFTRNGLIDKNYAMILLSTVDAYKLAKIADALAEHAYWDAKGKRDEIKKHTIKFTKLNNKRVDVVHSAWIQVDQASPDKIIGAKGNRDTMKVNFSDQSIKELQKTAQDCWELAEQIFQTTKKISKEKDSAIKQATSISRLFAKIREETSAV